MAVSRRRRGRVVFGLTLIIAILALVVWRSRHHATPFVTTTDPVEEPEPAPRAVPTSSPRASAAAPPATATPPETEEQRFIAQMAATKATLLEKTRYPLDSRPLALKTDLLMPHHVEPIMRGLAAQPNKSHGVLITQNQDRVWLSPGQPAIATITAMQGQQPTVLTVQRSDLFPQIEDAKNHTTPGPVIGHPAFRDDGVAPDTLAGDGTWTTTVALPATVTPGAVTLSVDAEAGGEQGTLLFNFVATLPPPAVFTQTARDALENGSIAIYVGVSVQVEGRYQIAGRLYDSTGAPIVYMSFTDQLTTASTEVRLLAFGKVILDEGGVPPFFLRDVEGAEILIGQYPDRAPMVDWPGPYPTASYPLSSLSDADYDGPDKQQKILALERATQDGIANIRANPSPSP